MANFTTAVVSYLKDAKSELTKVTWPTRKQTLRYSVIVVAACVVVAAFFAALDFGLDVGLQTLVKLVG